MVLHGIALHLMILHSLACHCIVSYGVAWYCIVGFGAGCISQDTYLLYSMECCPDEEEDEESVARIWVLCVFSVVVFSSFCFLHLFGCLFVCLFGWLIWNGLKWMHR